MCNQDESTYTYDCQTNFLYTEKIYNMYKLQAYFYFKWHCN